MKRAPGFFFLGLFSSIEMVCHHLGYLQQAAQPLSLQEVIMGRLLCFRADEQGTYPISLSSNTSEGVQGKKPFSKHNLTGPAARTLQIA